MKLIVKVNGKVLTSLPEEGAVGGAINDGKEKPKARKKLIVKLGGKVLKSLPEEGPIHEGGAIKYGGSREKLSALKVAHSPSPCRTPRTSKKKKSSLSAEKKKLGMEAVKIKPQTLRQKMEAFYESWETEDYYDGDGWNYEDRYFRHLNLQLSTPLHDGDRTQPAAEKMEKPRQSTALVRTNDDFFLEKIMKNKKRKLMQESEKYLCDV